MTIDGGKPHRVGYAGQRYRIVVDEDLGRGEKRKRTLGWTNKIPTWPQFRKMETRPDWSNARCEVVEDAAKEAQG